MPINIYETRTMMEAIERSFSPASFLLDTFFPNVDTQVNEKIDVDFKKGKRIMAPFVAPRIGGVVMKRQGYSTKTYDIPKIAPERIITIDDISKRSMGEGIYSKRTPEERAATLLAKDLSELDEYILRREEWMCREVLFAGKVTMKGEGFEQEIDYGFDNKVVLSGSDLWSHDESDPIQFLREIRRKTIKKTGVAPDTVVLDSKSTDAFLNNKKVKEYMDNKRINLGSIEPSIKNDSITFIAKLPSLGLEIYAYDEWYLDDNEVEQPMMPEGYILVAPKGRNRISYGAVSQYEKDGAVTYEGSRVPKKYIDEKNDTESVRLTARPLPVPDDVDSWYVVKVV